jgi:replicative DNA helicase
MKLQTPAQNIEAEESLIATLIMNNSFFNECEFLRPDEFYKTAHQKIYSAMSAMHSKKTPVDLVTLTTELEKLGCLKEIGGASYLVRLIDYSPAFNTKQYVSIIKECALTKKIKDKCMQVIDSDLSGEDLLEYTQKDILNIQSTTREDNIKAVRDIIFDHIERIEKANATEQGMGYKLGFPNIDSRLRVIDGKLIVIAGRPKMGKTALAVTMARNLDKAGVHVGFLSIEMPESEIMDRWLSMISQVDSSKLGRYGALKREDIQNLNDAAALLYESNIKIDETGSLDIADVERKCRKLKKAGSQVIFIDQLSQIGNKQIKDGELTSLYSTNCTRIARLKKELGLPIFLLHQLNRDVKNRAEKEPIVTDLKQTGKIEEDADAVLFIHRPEEYVTKKEEKKELKGISILTLALNRQGPTYRDTKIKFDHETTYFYQGGW